MEKISVVVSCYNEEESIPLFYNEIKKVMEIMKEFQFEVLFVDDGSKDRTLEVAKELAKKPNYLTVPAAIRELEKIELIRQSDWGYRMDYAVTATQKEILKAFNMTAANIRTQAAAMNEYLMQIEKEG